MAQPLLPASKGSMLVVGLFATLAAAAALLLTQLWAGPGFASVDPATKAARTKLPLPAWVAEAQVLTRQFVTSSPDALEPVDQSEARRLNAAIPIVDSLRDRARPYVAQFQSAADFGSAVHCLATAVYYEAASEPLIEQRAVAQVVLNRSRHPAFPSTVCGVVFQGSERTTGCQFSFTCDGSLRRRPSRQGWQTALGVAQAALSGYVEPSVGLATHYHTDWVFPYWSPKLVKINQIGAHIFLRLGGAMGRANAFQQAHIGLERYPQQPAPGVEVAADPTAAEPPMPSRDMSAWASGYHAPLRAGSAAWDREGPANVVSLDDRAVLPARQGRAGDDPATRPVATVAASDEPRRAPLTSSAAE